MKRLRTRATDHHKSQGLCHAVCMANTALWRLTLARSAAKCLSA